MFFKKCFIMASKPVKPPKQKWSSYPIRVTYDSAFAFPTLLLLPAFQDQVKKQRRVIEKRGRWNLNPELMETSPGLS
jgi:hypothetical protein